MLYTYKLFAEKKYIEVNFKRTTRQYPVLTSSNVPWQEISIGNQWPLPSLGNDFSIFEFLVAHQNFRVRQMARLLVAKSKWEIIAFKYKEMSLAMTTANSDIDKY